MSNGTFSYRGYTLWVIEGKTNKSLYRFECTLKNSITGQVVDSWLSSSPFEAEMMMWKVVNEIEGVGPFVDIEEFLNT